MSKIENDNCISNEELDYTTNNIKENEGQTFKVEKKEKSFVLAYIIWFFLGILGVHRIYLEKYTTGLIIMACTLLSFLTFGLSAKIAWIWWLVDIYFTYEYTKKYNENNDQ